MADILVVYDRMEPPVEITRQFFLEFIKLYPCKVSFIQSSELNIVVLNECDVLIEIRPQSMFLARIAKMIKTSGRTAVAMYDDDFLAIKDFHLRRRIQEKAIISVLNNIDVLMCTNESLLKKYRDIGDVTRFVKTDTAVSKEEIKTISEYEISTGNANDNKIKIVYYCNDGSTDAFETIIGSMTPQIVSSLGDIIEWTFIGTTPKVASCVKEENIRYIQHLSLEEFRRELRDGNYSCGIAPLFEDEFSGHKYINKFIEFTCAGIPCIYSNVSPYKECISDGVDGLLCDNNTGLWIDALIKMRDPNTRYRLIKNAQLKLLDEYSVTSIADRIVSAIPEMGESGERRDKRIMKENELLLAKAEEKCYYILDVLSRINGRAKAEGIHSLISYSVKKVRMR